MTTLKEKIEREKNLAEELIAEAEAYYASVGPVEVDAVLGETKVTFQVPFMYPIDFNELASTHWPRPGVAVDAPLWFNLDAVTKNYPNITMVVDGEEDDLYRVRNKEAVYIFPELYAQMPPEDAQNLRMAVWALNIWEPQQRREKKVAEKKEAENG
ncbi:hypothetical protein [Microbacterium sp. 3J1]|uniref:hypothetical protein n=1 Tax=Microbacterium sp. 3J1 TaxID=861269 RepID=UPI000AF0C41F|nr:hypothetical protein [Microbacterium sp. 3J1]